jgi:hypothetical protein
MESGSQVCQDKFVTVLFPASENKQRFFLDIGAHDPIHINNTYSLEKTHGWKGLSIDITDYSSKWTTAARKTPFLNANALKLNWKQLWAEKKYPLVVDYLSLDIDEAQHEFILKSFPWKNIEFRVATIEHDSYRFGSKIRDDIRAHLLSFGYKMIVQDVQNKGVPFEDWWISPKHFTHTNLAQQSWKNLDGHVAVKTIADFLAESKSSKLDG